LLGKDSGAEKKNDYEKNLILHAECSLNRWGINAAIFKLFQQITKLHSKQVWITAFAGNV
jgi:hypothetical protein